MGYDHANVNFEQNIFSLFGVKTFSKESCWDVSLKKTQTWTYPSFHPRTDRRFISTTPLPGTNSSRLCSTEFVSVYLHLCTCVCVSIHVYVSCMDPIISLALLSSPVCLSRAQCLLGAACPPKRLLQHNHFKT